jgi:hypothetical protein
MSAKPFRFLGRSLSAALFVASIILSRGAACSGQEAKPSPAKPDAATDGAVKAETPKSDGESAAPKLLPGEADSGSSASKASNPAAKPLRAKAPAKVVKTLSPEMVRRRDGVRQLLTALRTQPFNTQQNTCSDVLAFCLAFGCETELADSVTSGQKINGITCLCWNMPCSGYNLLTVSEGHLAPRVGYGCQDVPSEMAAVLALSHVPENYPARAGRYVRTVSDLIEYEKLACRAGSDMSLKLVALATYVHEPAWKDSLGGQWTLKRMVREELDRPEGTHAHAATDRLLGLCVALERFKDDKVPLEGDLGRAKRYVDEAIPYIFAAQNSDGSWGRAANGDYAGTVANTSRMLECLLASLPANRMEDSQVVRGIDYLYAAFSSPHYQNYIATMSSREISAAMHAAYVLNTYDRRVFAPLDEKPAETKPAEKAASRPAHVQ